MSSQLSARSQVRSAWQGGGPHTGGKNSLSGLRRQNSEPGKPASEETGGNPWKGVRKGVATSVHYISGWPLEDSQQTQSSSASGKSYSRRWNVTLYLLNVDCAESAYADFFPKGRTQGGKGESTQWRRPERHALARWWGQRPGGAVTLIRHTLMWRDKKGTSSLWPPSQNHRTPVQPQPNDIRQDSTEGHSRNYLARTPQHFQGHQEWEKSDRSSEWRSLRRHDN